MILPPTRSQARRCASYTPAAGSLSEDFDGVLVIGVADGKAAEMEFHVYELLEQPAVGGRVFLLEHQDLDRRDVYEVAVGPRGCSCTCPSGGTRRACKHRDALEALCASGEIPARLPPQPR